MQSSLVSLEEKVVTALSNPNSYLWFPDLTQDLVTAGLKRLEERLNISEFNYGTARVMLEDPNQGVDIAFQIPVRFDNQQTLIPIEMLPSEVVKEYKKKEVEFYSTSDFVSDQNGKVEMFECLNDAFEIIKQVPHLFRTVISLVKSIHLLQTDSDEYDISFSDPNIPFSIFVSIPRFNTKVNALRVAEAVIHEAMHLQLTLIEKTIPLIKINKKNHYSPWKKEFRTTQGISHAIYVFQVINKFYELLLAQNHSDFELNQFMKTRQKKITKEISQIQISLILPDLTETGRLFNQLISSPRLMN